jgi:hypothetical protein
VPFVDGTWAPSGCRDCDSLTGGRCWQHAVQVFIPNTIVPITVSPSIIWPQPVVLPYDRFLWPTPAPADR